MKQFSKKIVLAAALMYMLPTAMLRAQDTLTVSLSKALEIAMSQSPTIKVAEKEIQRVSYSKKERQGNLLPFVSASAAYQRAVKKQKMYLDGFNMSGLFPPITAYALSQAVIQNPPTPDVLAQQAAYEQQAASGDGSIEVGRDNTLTAGITASLPIISPTLWATIKMSDIELELVNESARATKLSLKNQVTKAYYGILLAQDSYNVFKHSYENTVENARIIKSKYQQGSASEFEWLRLDVQVRNAQSNLITAETAVNMSVLQLKMLLGMDMFTGLKVEGSLADFEANMYGDVLTIDTTALKGNTDLNQFDIKSKQLDHSLKIQKANWWPTLAASFNYQYMSMANDDVRFSNYTWFPTSTAGVQLSIPLFQGGGRVYKEKQLKVQMDEMKYQRDNLRRSLEMQLITYMDNIKKAISKIESNKEGVRQADKAMLISQKRYEVGSGVYLDVTNSQLAYIQAGLAYNQSIFDYLSAKADIEKLLSSDK